MNDLHQILDDLTAARDAATTPEQRRDLEAQRLEVQREIDDLIWRGEY